MHPPDLARLRAHYGALSDTDLTTAVGHGPAGFASADAWSIVTEIARSRGIDVPVEQVATPTISPEGTPHPAKTWTGWRIARTVIVSLFAFRLVTRGLAAVVGNWVSTFLGTAVADLIVLGLILLFISWLEHRSMTRNRQSEPPRP